MLYMNYLQDHPYLLKVTNGIESIFPSFIQNFLGLQPDQHPLLIFFIVAILATLLLSLFVPVPLVMLSTILFVEAKISVPALLIGVYASSYFGALLGSGKILPISFKIMGKLKEKLRKKEGKPKASSLVLSIAVLRHIPIAPYTIVNMALGQLGAAPKMVSLGSTLGLAPNILLLSAGKHIFF